MEFLWSNILNIGLVLNIVVGVWFLVEYRIEVFTVLQQLGGVLRASDGAEIWVNKLALVLR